MSIEYHLNADPHLDTLTIVASFSTARELRRVLRGTRLNIEFSPTHSDDVISVSPELFDQFATFLTLQKQ